MIDGENGSDDSADQGGKEVKDQDVDETRGKNERVYSEGWVLHAEKNGV